LFPHTDMGPPLDAKSRFSFRTYMATSPTGSNQAITLSLDIVFGYFYLPKEKHNHKTIKQKRTELSRLTLLLGIRRLAELV